MRAYFIQIAAVRLAARLLGKKLIDNYGFHGALPRFENISLAGIAKTEGIDEVPAKAESFNFGRICGDILNKHLASREDKELLLFEAAAAKNLFLDMSPEKTARYTDAELRNSMGLIFHALLKRAQIRTHTAKPGGEDINRWIEGYYRLERDYTPYVFSLIDQILDTDPAAAVREREFFDKEDAIISLALRDRPVTGQELNAALGKPAHSLLGKILEEAVSKR